MLTDYPTMALEVWREVESQTIKQSLHYVGLKLCV